MVRFWTLEAIAHGAEVVSYFRWRQAPFAQEQMHAGLLRPDRTDDVGAGEVRTSALDIERLAMLGAFRDTPHRKADVALVFDYASTWVTAIQPQGEGQSALRTAFEWFSALRRLGLEIDIVPPTAEVAHYPLVVVPCLPMVPASLIESLRRATGRILLGCRTGSKTDHFSIPDELPPGPVQSLIPLRVTRVESLRHDLVERGDGFEVRGWFEHIETTLVPELSLSDHRGVLYQNERYRYLAAQVDPDMLRRIFKRMASEAGVRTRELPESLRMSVLGRLRMAFNHSTARQSLRELLPTDTSFVIGGFELDPAGVAAWIEDR
jgi:beta-galactosidase